MTLYHFKWPLGVKRRQRVSISQMQFIVLTKLKLCVVCVVCVVCIIHAQYLTDEQCQHDVIQPPLFVLVAFPLKRSCKSGIFLISGITSDICHHRGFFVLRTPMICLQKPKNNAKLENNIKPNYISSNQIRPKAKPNSCLLKSSLVLFSHRN